MADTLEGMLSVLPGFTYALHFRFERMREAAQRGYLNAMAAATYLTSKGVPFRTAHEKVGNSVRYAIEKGVELGGLTLEELRQFGEEFGEDFYAAVALDATLDCHDVMGGTARARVREALAAAPERVAALARQTQGWGGHSCWCVRHCCRMPPTCTTS